MEFQIERFKEGWAVQYRDEFLVRRSVCRCVNIYGNLRGNIERFPLFYINKVEKQKIFKIKFKRSIARDWMIVVVTKLSSFFSFISYFQLSKNDPG